MRQTTPTKRRAAQSERASHTATEARPNRIPRNLRHLRLCLAVEKTGSLTRAAAIACVSQPAVTQALRRLETRTGGPLFDRTGGGLFPTPRGAALLIRLRRAVDMLDAALSDVAPRLKLTATSAQLQALVAMLETENYTLAARKLGLAQPTVHRAIAQLEQEAGRRFFERTSFGMVASPAARGLARAVMLAFRELDHAEADLAELDGGEGGRIVIGALPLSQAALLPKALARFRCERDGPPIQVIDGRYDDLLTGLRRGDIDVVIGALRTPAPIADIVQEPLFHDRVAVVAGDHHPLVGGAPSARADLHAWRWVVPRACTPSRAQFDAFFADLGPPASVIETGSFLLMREILRASDHLGCVSRAQAQAEISAGLLSEVAVETEWRPRPIGLTYRANWVPTAAQRLLTDLLRDEANDHRL